MKQDRRGSWYLLTGTVLGVALGLVYSWVVSPVKYKDAPPYALRADYKEEYRVLVASAYLYSNDLIRAQARLAQLNDEESAQSLARQAQQALAEGRSEQEVRALGLLATALSQVVTPATSTYVPTTMPTLVPAASDATPGSILVEPGYLPIDTIQATSVPPSLDLPQGH